MLEFYAAARQLLYPSESRRPAGKALPPPHSHEGGWGNALIRFERCNRGHQRILGDLRLAAGLPPAELSALDDETRSRRSTVAHSASSLLRAVLEAPSLAATSTYSTAALDALMNATDNLGWFNNCIRDQVRALEHHVHVRMKKKLSGFRVDPRLELHDTGFAAEGITQPCLRLTLRLDRGSPIARTVRLPYLYCATLRDARYLLDGARHDLDALVDDVLNWPELAEKVAVQATHDKIRQGLENLVGELSPEEVAYLHINWTRLLPEQRIHRWQALYNFAKLTPAPEMVRAVKVSVSQTEAAFVDEVKPMILSATAEAQPYLDQFLMSLTGGSAWLRRESRGTAELQTSFFVKGAGSVSLSQATNSKRLPSQWFSLLVDDVSHADDDEELLEVCVKDWEFAQILFKLLVSKQLVLAWATE